MKTQLLIFSLLLSTTLSVKAYDGLSHNLHVVGRAPDSPLSKYFHIPDEPAPCPLVPFREESNNEKNSDISEPLVWGINLLRSSEPLPPASHDPTDDHSNFNNQESKEGDFLHVPMPCPLMPFDREDLVVIKEDSNETESPNIQRTLETAKGIYSALNNELEEDFNKNIEYAVSRLESSIYIFDLIASGNREESETSISCEEEIQRGLKTFNSAISLLESRKCNGVHVTERCIPQEIADKYIPSLKELHTELQSNPNICD